MDEDDLQAFARMWEQAPDGRTGQRYSEALVQAGRIDDAAAVCRAVWDLGYPDGLFELAWLELDRGEHDAAIALLVDALPELDDDDRALAEGTVGHWRWFLQNDVDAEQHLRAGQDAYPTARADLAHLLLVTGRQEEGRAVFRQGVAAGETESMLPLANLLDRDGDHAGAEALYRRSAALGDAFSAWNLSLLLAEQGRREEAEQWRWHAAQGGDEFAIRYYTENPHEQPPE